MILLHDTTPDQEKDLIELKVKKGKIASAPDAADINGEAADEQMDEDLAAEAAAVAAAAAAAEEEASQSLYFVDEDEEDATVPEDFEYESDGNESDRMEE